MMYKKCTLKGDLYVADTVLAQYVYLISLLYLSYSYFLKKGTELLYLKRKIVILKLSLSRCVLDIIT